jgi:two-component system response regulator MprA
MCKHSILVVEDDDDIRNTMRALLEMEGYNVQCAANGDEGIQALRRCESLPCLILLDMTMPVMDGFQFCEEQKQDVNLAPVPVLVMTADGNAEAKTIQVGAKGFIKKPFDIDHVIELVGLHC